MSVIDRGLRVSQCLDMLTADDIREELIRQLEAKKLTGAYVAAKLNIAPARVTEMKNRERRVQQEEMPALAALLGLAESSTRLNGIARSAKVPHLGKVAQGLWLAETYSDPNEPEFVDYDMRPGDPSEEDLFAVTPEGQSMNLIFPAGIQLICQRIPFGRTTYKSRDLVIVERHAHDLREMTCKRLIIDEEGNAYLKSESDRSEFQEPWLIGKPSEDSHSDNEITVIGRVLRGVINYVQ